MHSSCKNCLLQTTLCFTNGVDNCRLQIHTLDGAVHAVLQHKRCDTRSVREENWGEAIVFELAHRCNTYVDGVLKEFVELKESSGYYCCSPISLSAEISLKPIAGGTLEVPHSWFHSRGICPQSSSWKDRKSKTSIQRLAQFFHLPINLAGQRLNICPTVLKKICRKHGLRRWPHRKLQSIDKLIKKLEASIGDVDESSIQSSKIEAKIAFLRKERGDICFENVEGYCSDKDEHR